MCNEQREETESAAKKLEARAVEMSEAIRDLYKYEQIAAYLKEAKRLSTEIKEELEHINFDFSALS